MANHKGPVPDFLTTNYMQNILQQSLKTPILKLENIEVTPGSSEGDNYICQVFRIKAYISGKEKPLSIIGKYNKQTALVKDLGDDYDLFHLEIFFFDKLLAKLNKSVREYTPTVYHTDLDNNIFFMNDLMEDGYTLKDRTAFVKKEEALLVIKSLAVFHAATYYAVKEDPSLKTHCPHTIWKQDCPDPMKKMFKNAVRMTNKALDFYELPSRYEEILKECGKRIEDEWCGICTYDEDKLNFLLHGDCWKSNILFKYNADKVESVKLLDFQVLNYNCFANDLIYFLFSSVQVDDVIENIDQYLELYYNTLISSAPDIPDISLDRIKREFADRLYFGFLLLLDFRPIFYSATPPDVDAILRSEDVELGFFTEGYKRDVQKLMPFFDSYGVFD